MQNLKFNLFMFPVKSECASSVSDGLFYEIGIRGVWMDNFSLKKKQQPEKRLMNKCQNLVR